MKKTDIIYHTQHCTEQVLICVHSYWLCYLVPTISCERGCCGSWYPSKRWYCPPFKWYSVCFLHSQDSSGWMSKYELVSEVFNKHLLFTQHYALNLWNFWFSKILEGTELLGAVISYREQWHMSIFCSEKRSVRKVLAESTRWPHNTGPTKSTCKTQDSAIASNLS